jgi:hypothetical protein
VSHHRASIEGDPVSSFIAVAATSICFVAAPKTKVLTHCCYSNTSTHASISKNPRRIE